MKKKNVMYYQKYRYTVNNILSNVWKEGYIDHITKSVCSRMNWIWVVNHVYDFYNPGVWELRYIDLVEERRII